jgi:hypothetical protein
MIEVLTAFFFGSVFGVLSYLLATALRKDFVYLKNMDPVWCAIAGFGLGWIGFVLVIMYVLYKTVVAYRG